jgi:choline dehydrogenase
MPEYEYIVVGAGTAGCVVAARLSQDAGTRVLLLEAGSSHRTRATTVPNAWPDNLGSSADWGNITTGQADSGSVAYPRGRAVGGSSAINAMAHVRGHRAVYDGWLQTGRPAGPSPICCRTSGAASGRRGASGRCAEATGRLR